MENSTKMGVDKTPNAPRFIRQICLPKAQKFGISIKKRLHWASVISDSMHDFGYAAKVKLATIALQ